MSTRQKTVVPSMLLMLQISLIFTLSMGRLFAAEHVETNQNNKDLSKEIEKAFGL